MVILSVVLTQAIVKETAKPKCVWCHFLAKICTSELGNQGLSGFPLFQSPRSPASWTVSSTLQKGLLLAHWPAPEASLETVTGTCHRPEVSAQVLCAPSAARLRWTNAWLVCHCCYKVLLVLSCISFCVSFLILSIFFTSGIHMGACCFSCVT